MTEGKARALATRTLPWLSTLAIVALAVLRLQHYYPLDLDASGNSDAFFTYLPSARRWLEQGWIFLLNDPFSTRVAPLGYLWPALWQADVTAIRWANGGLFVASALIMARASQRLGGPIGATVAVLLLLYHPGIAYYMPKVLTEPLYLFGLMLLSWSLIEILLRSDRAQLHWYVLGSIGLTITLLTRPVLQLVVAAAMLLVLLALVPARLQAWRPCLRKLTLMLATACILPAAVIVKNSIQFDLWSLGTGSGAGLYYGLNPLTLGHEPSFMGFEYDVGEVVRAAAPATQGEPLDRTADRIERAVAVSLLENTHAVDLVRFFGFKLRSWLLYSTPELGFDPRLRKFRLFEWLCLAAAVLLWLLRRRQTVPRESAHDRRKTLVLVLLGLGTALMVIQLLPLLYNTRYNAGFLEPWLLLLTSAAVGALLPAWRTAHDWHWRAARWRQLALLLILMAAAVVLTRRASRHEVLAIDPLRLGPVASVLDRARIVPIGADVPAVDTGRWRLDKHGATLEIGLLPDSTAAYPAMDFMDGVWRFHLRVVAAQARSCRTARLKLEHPADARDWPKPNLGIVADGQWHTYAIHGNHDLRPMHPGRLWISFDCPPGTEITWGAGELLRSTMPQAAHALWVEGKAIDPYTPLPWPTHPQ